MTRDTWTHAVREDSGFTLVELLVVMALFTVVMSAVLGVFDFTGKLVPRDRERTHAVVDAQTGVSQMVRELRQAEDVFALTPNAMEVLVTLNGQLKDVRYDCDVAFTPDDPTNPYDQNYRRCVRREANTTATATGPPTLPALSSGRVVIDRICPGTAAATCDSAASKPIFTCPQVTQAAADLGQADPGCGTVPQAVDPDNPPDPGDDPVIVWPTYIKVAVTVPQRGEAKSGYSNRFALNDGFFLRNLLVQQNGNVN